MLKNQSGMRTFWVMWLGQFVSLLGSSMTAFAVPIWVFGKTERVQELALLGLAFLIPFVVFGPIAGAVVDRNSRKWMMILSDLMSGLTTIAVLVLVNTGTLEIWHLYITSAINGTFQTIQWPAYSSAITMMVPKEQYGRANGLTSLARSGAEIFAPVAAGALLGFIGLQGILFLDVVTFIFAIGTLLFIHVPQPPHTAIASQSKGSIWQESLYGFRYIWARPSLLGLQSVFLICNSFAAVLTTILTAMILYRTDQDATILAWVSSSGAIGGVVGGLVMSAWGGPKRQVYGVLLGWMLAGTLGILPIGLGRVWPFWAAGMFTFMFAVPILNGSNQAIWQIKVPPDVQGRVFTVRRVIAQISTPIAKLLMIPLADQWLEPAMQPDGNLVTTFGWLVGSGPGAGTALLFVFAGLAILVTSGIATQMTIIRDVEDILPDHDVA